MSSTNGSSSGTYSYDGNGHRVQKVSGSTTTVYIVSGTKVIAEYDNGAAVGSPSREYIYGGTVLLAKIDSTGTKYYHQDHLSNRLVTDSSGNIYAQLGHFPFGEKWYNTTSDKFQFTTYERDAESGNDYAMARMYVNRLADFSSVDPIAGDTRDPQTLSSYLYTRDDPVNFVDPTGKILGPYSPDECEPDEDIDVCSEGGGGAGPCADSGPPVFNPLPFTPLPCPNPNAGLGGLPAESTGGGGRGKIGPRQLVLTVLQGNNNCSQFFNGAPLVQASAAFAALFPDAGSLVPTNAASFFQTDKILPGPLNDDFTGAGTWEGMGAGAIIVTNQSPTSVYNSAFQTNGKPYPYLGTFSGGSVGAQAIMLLHELGHTLLLLPPDSTDAVAAGFPTSQQNTQTILDHCLEAIQQALRAN